MILLQAPPPPPPPPNGWNGNTPFAPCGDSPCIPIDEYVVVLVFVALLYGFYKLIKYGNKGDS